MGHRNIQFTGHMLDPETDPRGHNHLHTEPCIFYGGVSNYPQPHIHPVVPTPGNQCNFNFHHLQEHLHESPLFYGIPQYNTGRPQHPPSNLDLAVASSSGHYNPYLVAPQSGLRDFPVQINHGAHDQLSLSATHRLVGIPNIPYMDSSIGGLFKRKNADVGPANYQYHHASAGPSSSSVGPINARPSESDINVMDAAPSYLPHEYGGNSTNLIQGNYPPVPQLPGNRWPDMHFAANNGDINALPWTQAPNIPYGHAGANAACVEVANIGYPVTASNRNAAAGYLHSPPIGLVHHNPHHPNPPVQQGVRGYNVNYHPPHMAARIPTITTSNTGVNHFQDADPGPTFLAPIPPTGFRLYRPHRREIIIDSNARHRNLPHLRVLPEDEVAILEIPGYHEAGDSNDQLRDMRLDIDHMSYEELLALGEQIGSVGTGLSEEYVRNNLKARTFKSSEARINLEDATGPNQQINFCVICQTDYEHEDCIATLDCGHEYHKGCVNKWLHLKNTCPVCKSVAVSGKGKNL